jgi:lipopolysaccharide transport system permease protein
VERPVVHTRVQSSPDIPVTTIRPARHSLLPDVRELWRYHGLAFTFAWRDVKVRYKQSLIGVLWAVLQPFLTMVVFTIIFGKFANFPSEGLQYTTFVYTGLVPWALFASTFTLCSSSVVANRALVQRVYFPRLVMPLSTTLVPLVDFCCSFVVVIGVMIYYGDALQWTAIFAPFFLLLLGLAAVGAGSFLSVINVRYRDVVYTIPFVVQLWLYVSPIIYPVTGLPEKYQEIVYLNPVVLGITGFRWAVAGTPAPSASQFALGIVSTLVLFAAGVIFFRRSEPKFADLI